ncbi:MAG: aminomethyl-transferring glycine dehydrogenase subunit GcvPB [Candidatus Cloacimonetes bacterium]|nr:aminomethyl-transferring glycine dehydrogenase subunit GcvPB [Candidatus Cloacimonadota bacterium]
MSKTIFEKNSPGRKGYTLPQNDVDFSLNDCIPAEFQRKAEIRLPQVSELDVMRHFIELSHKNHFVEKGFYPLGSCTMKYNPKISDTLVNNSAFTQLHPFQPDADVQGSLKILWELQNYLAEIAGFGAVSLQPVAGAHGEFTGLKVIQYYHEAKGNQKTQIILPDSAHGTNPASASLCGYEIVEIASNDKGMVDLEALRAAVNEKTAGFMLTNPNTLGIFESQICEIAEIIHAVDGLMYMDGANFNAIMGIVKPGEIGFDVMHFNLHKSFSTPHGGGGPGSGPVGVRADLAKFLPSPQVAYSESRDYYLDDSHAATSMGKVQAFYGNFLVNVRAWFYFKMLGTEGVKRVSENAVINANYLMRKLEKYYYVPYNDNCMHEFVASGQWQKKEYGVHTIDIAKRLLDKGYHAPTIYFPLIVPEAIMIEPTETESMETLDDFIQAMIDIAEEAKTSPQTLHDAPLTTPIRRADDVRAVKELNTCFDLCLMPLTCDKE